MISLTEESGPSQDIRTEKEFPLYFFLGRISTEMVLRILDGFKKVEALDVKARILGFTEGPIERVAIEEEGEEEEEE